MVYEWHILCIFEQMNAPSH